MVVANGDLTRNCSQSDGGRGLASYGPSPVISIPIEEAKTFTFMGSTSRKCARKERAPAVSPAVFKIAA